MIFLFGLANVEFEGDRDPEIWIEVPANNLKELKLSIEDISTRVSASSIDLPSGSSNSGGISTLIRSKQLAKTPQELRQIEMVAMETGEKLYLKDIANIFETFQENHRDFSSKGNKAAGGRARKSIGEIMKLVTDY